MENRQRFSNSRLLRITGRHVKTQTVALPPRLRFGLRRSWGWACGLHFKCAPAAQALLPKGHPWVALEEDARGGHQDGCWGASEAPGAVRTQGLFILKEGEVAGPGRSWTSWREGMTKEGNSWAR